MNIALLRKLRDAGGAHLSLECLGATTAEVDELESFGFALERHPLLGVAYRGPAERLCPDQIEDALGTRFVGRRVAVWERVASTNDLAARAALSTANEGLVVLAEEQRSGRGRRGRTWTAPPRSSVLMSVLLFPDGPLADPAWLTALGAVAAAEVVAEWTGRDARIKWPNDVRVDGRKIAGVLVERGAGAVVGIGLNANLAVADLPAEFRDGATSLSQLVGGPVDRSEVVRALVRRLDGHYERARAEGPGPLARTWRDRSEHLARQVVVRARSAEFQGRLVELELLGAVVLETGTETLRLPMREVEAVSHDSTPDPPGKAVECPADQ